MRLGVAEARDAAGVRVRAGEGETGCDGSGASATLDGGGVCVKASDELGGVGSPPGASRTACGRLAEERG